MKKSIFFKLFGLGKVPKKILPLINSEEVVIMDEGIKGSFIANNINAPKKRYIKRIEFFLGSLIITKKRILCFSFWKKQINIEIKDPNLSKLYIEIPKPETLSISFESSNFLKGWSGVIRYDLKTEKADQFYENMLNMGMSQGKHP